MVDKEVVDTIVVTEPVDTTVVTELVDTIVVTEPVDLIKADLIKIKIQIMAEALIKEAEELIRKKNQVSNQTLQMS